MGMCLQFKCLNRIFLSKINIVITDLQICPQIKAKNYDKVEKVSFYTTHPDSANPNPKMSNCIRSGQDQDCYV